MTTDPARRKVSADLRKVTSYLVEIGQFWCHTVPASRDETQQRLRWAAHDLLTLLDGVSPLGPLALTRPLIGPGQVIGGNLRHLFAHIPPGTAQPQHLLLAAMHELVDAHAGRRGPSTSTIGNFLTGFCRLLADGHHGIGYHLALLDVDAHGRTVRRGDDLTRALPRAFAAAWSHWLRQLTQPCAVGSADPDDPTVIDWVRRRDGALIPFEVVGGYPVNPVTATTVAEGRGGLARWGENQAADAAVTAIDPAGQRWLLMVERGDGRGWALPGGFVDDREKPVDAAIRELGEETGLYLPDAAWHVHGARYVADSRASRRAWIVTTLVRTEISAGRHGDTLPALLGGDDAAQAAWLPAGSVAQLAEELDACYDGFLFDAHRPLLDELLGPAGPEPLRENVRGEAAGRLAARELRWRAVVAADMSGPRGSSRDGGLVPGLAANVDHLAPAGRDVCVRCGWVIAAPLPVTDRPARPAWHPGRWWQALLRVGRGLAGAGRALRHSKVHVAHTSCRSRRRS